MCFNPTTHTPLTHCGTCVGAPYTIQASVLTGIQDLESATHMANQLSLFSSNEEVEEITTTNLR